MFLKIKKIPIVKWSSKKPYNFKPKFSTFFFLCFGLMLFGLGRGFTNCFFYWCFSMECLSPRYFFKRKFKYWNSYIFNKYSSFDFMDSSWSKPGMGTLLNALIIALMIDICIYFVPTPSNYIHQLILAVVSVITVGIGGGIYLVSNLGAGPRDGLMIGLQKLSNLPISVVRAALEITVVSIGWYLGGTVGIGTLLFAFGIGPSVALGLYLVDKIFIKQLLQIFHFFFLS